MNKKFFLLFLLAGFTTLNSFSQTIKDKINTQAQDKNLKTNAAKADVFIHEKSIFNSSSTTIDTANITTDNAVKKIKYNKHKFKKKYKKTSK